MTEFENKKQKLIKYIEKLIILLEHYEVPIWPKRLNESLELIQKYDGYGVSIILSEYGGMGSLNDLWICSYNGHKVSSRLDGKLANIKLNFHRNRIYDYAKSLE